MGSLFTTLLNTTGTLQAYNRTLNVLQNNVSNANTPGYVRQDQVLIAMPFDPSKQLMGGVLPGPMISARSSYLEQNVRNQQEWSGYGQQKAVDLSQIEPLFSLTSDFTVPAALNKFFGAFSQLAVNPNDQVERQVVLDRAGDVAQSFRQAAVGISQAVRNVDHQIGDSVAGINRLLGQIAAINSRYRASAESQADAGLDAQLNAALEELAQAVNFTTIRTPDGAANIYLGGEAPLVIGDHDFPISADLSGPQVVIRDGNGAGITGQVERGRLGALAEEKNTTFPSYLATLHQLAAAFADTVNATLAQGVDRNGNSPAVNLFSYSSANDAAFSLDVTGIAPGQIAAALPAAPGGNGNAIAMAKLADSPSIAGFTFTQFYGNLGARIGRDAAAARDQKLQFEDAVTQAQAQRQDQTGVSLDEEAAKILQFQRAYQAVGKLVSVLDSLTETLLNMVR